MRVFISWSGPLSRTIALILQSWLRNVVQMLEPFVSSQDIHAGARWLNEVSRELQDTSCGVLCVTPDNVNAPWLNFEAGALAKAVDESRVCPLLFGLEPAELPRDSPLIQFQAARLEDEDDVHQLVRSLNDFAQERSVDTQVVDEAFRMWWPRLQGHLQELHQQLATDQPEGVEIGQVPLLQERIIEETLDLVRGLYRLVNTREAHSRYRYPGRRLPSPISQLSQEYMTESRQSATQVKKTLTSAVDLLHSSLAQDSHARDLVKVLLDRLDEASSTLDSMLKKPIPAG